MYVLLKKEIRNFFSSVAGPIVAAVFLAITGVYLFVIPSQYNVLDSGYANLDGLFALAPLLFLFLIPAVTMKLFADEVTSGTMEILFTKPIKKSSIVFSKFLAGWVISIIALIPTLLYMVSVGVMGLTPFNLDTGGFWGSFIGLLFLSAVYTAIGVFCSSLTKNSIVAFIISALLCFLVYYGLGIESHYDSMSRGVLDLKDVMYFVIAVYVFIFATIIRVASPHHRITVSPYHRITVFIILIVLYIASGYYVLRLDLTSEKRYTLSDNTKNLMRSIEKPVEVNLYLDGDMNSGFLRLKESTVNMLKELKAYSNTKFTVNIQDPSSSPDEKNRNAFYSALENKGMKPTMVYDRDSKGGMVQKIVFPWAEIIESGDTINLNLLKNVQGMSGEENLNASIESLEYELTDALRRLNNTNVESIAFIEGHGEWNEQDVYSATEKLALYYNVDRGVLGSDASVLDKYKVIIIASPIEKFSESDKFIIDQYIMYGGKVLWLLDGVRTDKESLGIANELDLEDMLFTYGVRISPLLLLDTQCTMMPVNVSPDDSKPQFEPMPWYYSPVLIPDPSNIITRNISGVKADFSSVIELVGENKNGIKASALLFSSAKAGLDKAPMQITPAVVTLSPESEFFAFSYLPVSVLLEGKFTSVFANRMVPPEITSGVKNRVKESSGAKMIFTADGDIIRNDVKANSTGYTPYPLGYDEYLGQTFGNEQFVLNSVNYLADDEGWLLLRGREFKIRLLNKNLITEYRTEIQAATVLSPLLLLIIFCFGYQIVRKRRWK